MNLKYMILGAGGTGGILGATLTKAGKDVTFIARGSNLDAMRNNGLIIRHLWDQTEEHLEVRALSMEESCALSLPFRRMERRARDVKHSTAEGKTGRSGV